MSSSLPGHVLLRGLFQQHKVVCLVVLRRESLLLVCDASHQREPHVHLHPDQVLSSGGIRTGFEALRCDTRCGGTLCVCVCPLVYLRV